MMKNEFLARLKELLNDLPQEEREEAVRYYEDYFADAGPLEEPRVLRELVSPEDVAEKIRAGCGGGKTAEGDVFSENIFGERAEKAAVGPDAFGVQDDEKRPEDSQMQESAETPKDSRMQDGGQWEPWSQSGNEAQEGWWAQEDACIQEQRMRMDEMYAQDYENTAGYEGNGRRSRTGDSDRQTYPHGATVKTKSYVSPIIFILALVIGIPVLCPIILAFIGIMVGFFFGFGLGGIGMVAGGVALIGNALSNISAGIGLVCLFSGGGLILSALGILFIIFAVNCAFRAIPALFRGIRHIVLALRGCRA